VIRGTAAALAEVPKTEKGRKTRERLLRAAGRALGKHGYPVLRIEQIAAEADLPVGLFYRYFRNKRHIVLEVLQLLIEEFRASIPAPGTASLWKRELALHRNYGLLFGEGKTGTLSCYFSDTHGEAAFQQFFARETHRYISEHSAAIRCELSPQRLPPKRDLQAIVLALLSMTESFLYRFFTGLEHLATVPTSHRIDFVWLLAALRRRGLVLLDPPRPHVVDLSRFRGPRTRHSRARRPNGPGPPRAAPRMSLRADSRVSLARIRTATLALLDSLGYEGLRLQDIERKSALTRGAIYYHFADKRELISSVLLDRSDALTCRLLALREHWAPGMNAREVLLPIASVLSEELCSAPGLLRAFYMMEERDQEFARQQRERRRAQADLIGEAIAGHLALDDSDQQTLQFMGAAFLCMAERLLFDTYLAKLPDAAAVRSSGEAAELLAALWHRMAFGSSPSWRGSRIVRALRRLEGNAYRARRH